MMSMLEGKKTYLVVVLTLVYAWAGFFTGHVDMQQAIELTSVALGAAGIRDAIAKKE